MYSKLCLLKDKDATEVECSNRKELDLLNVFFSAVTQNSLCSYLTRERNSFEDRKDEYTK